MILTTLPDLPPRPATAANAEFRRNFYARWGHENAIVCGWGREARFDNFTQTLSVKRVWGAPGLGGERYDLADRGLLVDDAHWLVLNEGQRYGSRLVGERPVFSFAVFLRPGLVEEVQGERAASTTQALDGRVAAASSIRFAERLRPPDHDVSPLLDSLRDAVLAGEGSTLWLDESALKLASRLLAQEPALAPNHRRGDQRATARAELLRRLHRAADRMQSEFEQPLTLDELAATACLSRWHFVRHFSRHFGLSPHAWLTRRRVTAAAQLLARGGLDAESVAQRCGFGSRFALRRALARFAPAANPTIAQDPHTTAH